MVWESKRNVLVQEDQGSWAKGVGLELGGKCEILEIKRISVKDTMGRAMLVTIEAAVSTLQTIREEDTSPERRRAPVWMIVEIKLRANAVGDRLGADPDRIVQVVLFPYVIRSWGDVVEFSSDTVWAVAEYFFDLSRSAPSTGFRRRGVIIQMGGGLWFSMRAEDRVAQIGTSSDAYEEEDERLYGQMPTVGQARTEEIRTEEVRTEGTTGLCPERGEPSGREMTPQVAVGRSNKDRMSVMIDIIADMMSRLRDVLARQNRAEVGRSPPRPHYRVAQEVPPRGSVTPVEEPGRELRGSVMKG
ncbi:hypothetical protein ACLOJK_006808 [Asimina triloba]